MKESLSEITFIQKMKTVFFIKNNDTKTHK